MFENSYDKYAAYNKFYSETDDCRPIKCEFILSIHRNCKA